MTQRILKTAFAWLFLTMLVPMTASADVYINSTNFPDPNFRNYLLATYYGRDGKITDAEIKGITEMNVGGSSDIMGNISSLKGIEYFTELRDLWCFYSPLTSLDVSKNTKLTRLCCQGSQLTSLDVSKNTELTTLYCYSNQLTSLDVSKNTELTTLYCYSNQLTSLDVSKNTELIDLRCSSNQLTSLDVSKNTALRILYCSFNQLTSLDVSKNTALTYLGCVSNQLISLDVSKNTKLTDLRCYYNQLTSLDVSKNTELIWLDCSYNQLTSLDVSKNTKLTTLYCEENQLTSLDVSGCTALAWLECYKNQIKRTYMDAFIESLPNNTESKTLRIYHSTGEGNTCTGSQVAAIKAKGWTPYYYDKRWLEFEGVEDDGIHMGIISFNDKINNLPITILNQETEPMFIDFVDNMEMANATLLYYAVDQAITTLGKPKYPSNLSNAMIITFTDGLDQGSLAMAPEHLTSRNYAQYLSNRISSTKIQNVPLQAYTIGLRSADVPDDDELFMLNLESLSSKPENAHLVADIAGVQKELTDIYEDLNRQTSQRVISVKVPMMSHGDKYRFTLDGTTSADKLEESKRWIEGVFSITDFSLNNVVYHGLTSASGSKITAERDGVYITFTFNDCRDEEGDILEIEKEAIDQWTYIASKDIWQHNVENDKDGNIKIEDIYTSAAIMFVLDCSTSLGDLFPMLKQTANSFINRLAGGYGDNTGIDGVTIGDEAENQNAPVEYYNLQGVKVATPGSGLYIRRQGNSVRKVMLK